MGIKNVVKIPDVFPLGPMLKKAFNATKTQVKAITKYGDSYISKQEFPYLLQYIKNYYIYWAIFSSIDVDNDQKLSLAEFNSAKPIFEANKVPIPDVKELFKQIDAGNNGSIDFKEFCHWVLINRIHICL